MLQFLCYGNYSLCSVTEFIHVNILMFIRSALLKEVNKKIFPLYEWGTGGDESEKSRWATHQPIVKIRKTILFPVFCFNASHTIHVGGICTYHIG